MADNIERQDHEAVEETGMASLQNGNVLDMRDSVKTKLVANIGPPNPKKVRQTSLKEAETRKELLPGQSQ